jgi:tetratricopeptide (TPR) repeat protein
MGEVLEAWDMVLCRTVALKVLRNMEPTAVIRFMHEAQIQARMAHPRICRIYDVESSDGTVKIAMHLVRGPNLELAARDLPLEVVVTLVAQVAEAIHTAHNLKLIHRDLKPSNILLERSEGGTWMPFVCDFGLAMALDEPSLTFTNGVLGTPAFMAPEQYRGERNLIGPATDIYGLGGTLHFALLGRPPGAPSPAVGTGTKPARKEIPADLWAIVRKCLEEDPALRYPTASALAEELWRFLNGEPVHATTATPMGRLLRNQRRRLRAVGAALLGLLGLTVLSLAERYALGRRQESSFAQIRHFAQEGAAIERDALLESLLPIHDLRPFHQKVRARMGLIRARMERGGPVAQGPGHWALARAHLLLGEFRQAQVNAQRAQNLGFHGSETAYILAKALALEHFQNSVRDGTPLGRQVESLFTQSESLEHSPDDFARTLTAFLQGDFGTALESARLAMAARPLDSERVCLASDCLEARALQSLEGGDFSTAEAHYQEALDLTQAFLSHCPSDAAASHRLLQAGQGLAALRLDRGTLKPDELAALLRRGDQFLTLNPEDPGLQEDWLGLRFLQVLAGREQVSQADQARNLPLDRTLDAAIIFLGTRIREPLPPALRRARMLLLWQAAERHHDHGQDCGPDLAEALKDLEAPPLWRRDFAARVLAFKAQVEMEGGQDPNPTVEALLTRIKEQGTGRIPLIAYPEAAVAWWLRARWDQAGGRDPSSEFLQARSFSEVAAQANPRSGRALAVDKRIRSRGGLPATPQGNFSLDAKRRSAAQKRPAT